MTTQHLPIGAKYDVTIDGVATTLTVDNHGVLRLPNNKLNAWLCGNIKSCSDDPRYGGLNALAQAHADGMFTLAEYREFYLNIGYSVSGLLGLSFFQGVECEYPPELEGYVC